MKDFMLYTLTACVSLLMGCVIDANFQKAEEREMREQLNNAYLVIRDAESNCPDFMDTVGETDAYHEYKQYY